MTIRRIAIDLRMVGQVPHGIARYSLGLWNHLPPRADVAYLALCGEGGRHAIEPRRPGDEIVLTRSRYLSPREQIEVPRVLRGSHADLLHATSFSVPRLWPGPLVITLHDLTHLRHPALHGPGRRLYYSLVVAPAVRRAKAVITVSRYEAGEIERRFGLVAGSVGVASAAVESGPTRSRHPTVAAPPLLLHVGNGKPHKNVELLLRARALMNVPARLVLVGEHLERFAGPTVEVRPRLDDAALLELYREAALFLFPSLSEGFGLPPLEAALAGTPVLVADAGALPEIWQGVAPLLPPNDAGAWAKEIEHLLSHPSEREQLAARCVANAARHTSWAPLIELAEASYRRALALPPS